MPRPSTARATGRLRTALALAVLALIVGWVELPFLLDRAIVVERDALSSILPMRAFLARALAAGEWPMWNPAPVLGKPFLAEWQTGLFYPPTALLLVPPFSRGFNLLFTFHYAWSALGAFLWLRVVGVTRLGALLGAVVWSCGGALVSLGHLLNHLMAVAWLPWVLWAWARPHRVRHRIVVAAAMLSFALFTGSPEMTLLIAGLLVVTSRDPRSLLVPPLAAGLAAAQLVPVWVYLGQTERGLHGMSAASVMAYSTSLGRIAGFVDPSAADSTAFLPTLYVGVVPVALALAGLWLAPTSRRLAALLVAIVLVGLALGANGGLLPLLYEWLPGVELLRYPEKLLVGVHALIAFGAAYGLAEVGRRLPGTAGVVAAALLVAIACADLIHANRGVLFTLPPASVFQAPPIARAMEEDAHAAGSSAVEPPPRYYANAVHGPRASSPAEVAGLDRAILFASTGELYGLGNVNTPASLNLASHERLQMALERAPRDRALAVLAALGTRWVTSFSPIAEGDGIREVPLPRTRFGARLYELTRASAHAFVAEQVTGAASDRAALERFVASADATGSRLAVLEGVEGAAEYRAPRQRDVRFVESGPDHLALEVVIDAAGLVIVNDTYLPGWRATIDGNPAAIERVNGLVRGVWVPAGRHRVEMRYLAPGLAVGSAISLSVLAAIGLVLAIVPRRARARLARIGRPEPALAGSYREP
ncbi:MAG: YfhO family protein [Deltaproteobacteria bacterium]|nr:YfhO family protein [Deltaproteobacteria bacterium]